MLKRCELLQLRTRGIPTQRLPSLPELPGTPPAALQRRIYRSLPAVPTSTRQNREVR